jgi:hypothetical protein
VLSLHLTTSTQQRPAPDANELARTLWINLASSARSEIGFDSIPQVLLAFPFFSGLSFDANAEAQREKPRIKTKNRDDHYRNENIALGVRSGENSVAFPSEASFSFWLFILSLAELFCLLEAFSEA